jgi:hypothetical protein
MPPYQEDFPVGTIVRVVDRPLLDNFYETWRYHHKLTKEQLEFAGSSGRVISIGFYHGGDVLYTLENIPGIWHESCVTAATQL